MHTFFDTWDQLSAAIAANQLDFDDWCVLSQQADAMRAQMVHFTRVVNAANALYDAVKDSNPEQSEDNPLFVEMHVYEMVRGETDEMPPRQYSPDGPAPLGA